MDGQVQILKYCPEHGGQLALLEEDAGGCAEILQISGGEPTLHPQILEIIEMAKQKSFKYVMHF